MDLRSRAEQVSIAREMPVLRDHKWIASPSWYQKPVNVRRQIWTAYLYPNYCQWCKETNYKTIAMNRFGITLKDLLVNQLRLQGVAHKHTKSGNFFFGVGIRKLSTEDYPSPLEAFFGFHTGNAEDHAGGSFDSCDTPETDEGSVKDV